MTNRLKERRVWWKIDERLTKRQKSCSEEWQIDRKTDNVNVLKVDRQTKRKKSFMKDWQKDRKLFSRQKDIKCKCSERFMHRQK